MNFTEARNAVDSLNQENARLQAMAQAEAENRRILAQSALDHIAGKIDAAQLVDLAKGMLE